MKNTAANQAQRDEYYARISAKNMAPLWEWELKSCITARVNCAPR